MLSYESSKWYVKIWRKRWYFIIPFLFIKINFIRIDYFDWLVEGELSGESEDKLWNSLGDIKRHIDLTKLKKYSA